MYLIQSIVLCLQALQVLFTIVYLCMICMPRSFVICLLDSSILTFLTSKFTNCCNWHHWVKLLLKRTNLESEIVNLSPHLVFDRLITLNNSLKHGHELLLLHLHLVLKYFRQTFLIVDDFSYLLLNRPSSVGLGSSTTFLSYPHAGSSEGCSCGLAPL